MRCEHVRERVLEAFLAGEAEVPVGLRPHVEGCPDCAAEIQRLKRGVLATKVIPHLGVDPPSGMKAKVFAEIERQPAARVMPADEAAPSRARETEPPTPRGLPFRGGLLRVLPIAAALAALCIGLAVVAVNNTPSRNVRILVERVRTSPALASCDELVESVRNDPTSWGVDSAMHQRTIEESRLVLQRVAGAGRSQRDVYAARETVEAKHLVDAMSRVANDCPDATTRQRAQDVLSALQDIQELDRK